MHYRIEYRLHRNDKLNIKCNDLFVLLHNIDINYCQKYEFSNSSQSGVIIKTFHMMYVQVYYCWSQYYIGPFVEY